MYQLIRTSSSKFLKLPFTSGEGRTHQPWLHRISSNLTTVSINIFYQSYSLQINYLQDSTAAFARLNRLRMYLMTPSPLVLSRGVVHPIEIQRLQLSYE